MLLENTSFFPGLRLGIFFILGIRREIRQFLIFLRPEDDFFGYFGMKKSRILNHLLQRHAAPQRPVF